MPQISSIEDLIQIIRQHPEWREALLSVLLPQDLLALPQEFRDFRAEVREMLMAHERRMQAHEERMAAIEEQIARQRADFEREMQAMRQEFQEQMQAMRREVEQRLQELRQEFQEQMQAMRQEFQEQMQAMRQEFQEQMQAMRQEFEQRYHDLRAEMKQMREEFTARFERIEEDIRQIREEEIKQLREGDIKQLRDDVGQLKGIVLELQWGHRARSYFGRLLRKVRVYAPGEICDEIEEEAEIPEPQRSQLLELDYIVRGLRRSDGREVYLAVEVSWGVGVTDVIRARDRAQILREQGLPAYPVAVGNYITPEAQSLAEAEGVVLMTDSQIQGAERLERD
ncbi:MAG: hypothetical protein N2045_05590 [Fimbriimonadales bacterium]|jgi:DNA repair exonuclease SbcCD ATPase subunit|nr:hypothetical protein [Fimbriimonadales bacterium]GIV14081.1 MAG: hypothetical protein KatS3mg021_2363 [Fimbriimonadales bacterium]CUU09602.1 hypothetical protein GBSOP10_106035 [Armatimonadetes bacterium GBS]CUU35176.1 hypothetical protein GXSOP10_119202 [Armatimonadetes bacterium GXS]